MIEHTTFKKPSEYNQGDIFEVEFIESLKRKNELFIRTDIEDDVCLCRLSDGKIVHKQAYLFGNSGTCHLVKNTILKRKGKW